ncbi:MAG TPA: thioesterase [Thermoanaerobaculia bacterium]|jgi:predicted thioesterase
MTQPEIQSTASAALVVGASDLASTFRPEPADSFPPMFSTARMVALMELASARLLRPLLRDDEPSIGVVLDVSHTAATPEGIEVKAIARYVGRDGKLCVFEVATYDKGWEIGRGTHERAIVSSERLLSDAARRNRKA